MLFFLSTAYRRQGRLNGISEDKGITFLYNISYKNMDYNLQYILINFRNTA